MSEYLDDITTRIAVVENLLLECFEERDVLCEDFEKNSSNILELNEYITSVASLLHRSYIQYLDNIALSVNTQEAQMAVLQRFNMLEQGIKAEKNSYAELGNGLNSFGLDLYGIFVCDGSIYYDEKLEILRAFKNSLSDNDLTTKRADNKIESLANKYGLGCYDGFLTHNAFTLQDLTNKQVECLEMGVVMDDCYILPPKPAGENKGYVFASNEEKEN